MSGRLLGLVVKASSSRAAGPGVRTDTHTHRLLDLVVKVSASGAADPGFDSPLTLGVFRVESHQRLYKTEFQLLPCQAPGLIGSELALVGPVSVSGDCVR